LAIASLLIQKSFYPIYVDAQETNIKVNSLDPGRMKTEMRRSAYPAENADKNPLPEDKSPAIVYLMSEKSN
jgi:NAD(P)-dependent dehydrogenase (short-subunit alcohol dehydrogenase family)